MKNLHEALHSLEMTKYTEFSWLHQEFEKPFMKISLGGTPLKDCSEFTSL